MKSLFSSLIALSVVAPFAVASQGPFHLRIRDWGASPFIACGSGVSGKAGIVVVHLRDGASVQSWSLQLQGSLLGPQGIEWAGKGTIRIETDAGGRRSSCQATAPSPFHVRSTTDHLAGTTLRVLAREPVLVEIQDARGRVLAARTVDPNARHSTTIGW